MKGFDLLQMLTSVYCWHLANLTSPYQERDFVLKYYQQVKLQLSSPPLKWTNRFIQLLGLCLMIWLVAVYYLHSSLLRSTGVKW